MRKSQEISDGIAVLVCIVAVIVMIFIAPALCFFCGWLGGWIAKVTIGGHLAAGLNLLFNTDRFSPDMLPLICGTLACFGSYFKSNINVNKRKKD